MSCFVMVRRASGPGAAAARSAPPRPCLPPRRRGSRVLATKGGHAAHRSSLSVPFSPPPACGAGPCFARIARGRARPSAPARFARLIARARQSAHLSRPFRWGSFSRRRETGDEAASRRPLPSSRPILPRGPRRSSPLRNYFKKRERTSGPAVPRLDRSRPQGRDMRSAHAGRCFAMPVRIRQNGAP